MTKKHMAPADNHNDMIHLAAEKLEEPIIIKHIQNCLQNVPKMSSMFVF